MISGLFCYRRQKHNALRDQGNAGLDGKLDGKCVWVADLDVGH